ncbi:MAG TPA: hypothetical protein VI934_01610, partial [Candidatus Nanoarchaeia archaeon]|nr:hypothetical protein [Candidatus Nanoarchaeia archaeon]
PRPVAFLNSHHSNGRWYADFAATQADNQKAKRACSAWSISAVAVNELSQFLALKLAIELFSIAKEWDVCFINANPPTVLAKSFQCKLSNFQHACMKACKPGSVKVKPVAQRLSRRAFSPFLKAFQASDTADNHQHKLHPSVLHVVVANRKAFLEELIPHFVDIQSHGIDSMGA